MRPMSSCNLTFQESFIKSSGEFRHGDCQLDPVGTVYGTSGSNHGSSQNTGEVWTSKWQM